MEYNNVNNTLNVNYYIPENKISKNVNKNNLD